MKAVVLLFGVALMAACTGTATGLLILKDRDEKMEVFDLVLESAASSGCILNVVNERVGVLSLTNVFFQTRITVLVKETETGINIDIKSVYVGKESVLAATWARDAVLDLCNHLSVNVPDAEFYINGKRYILEEPSGKPSEDPAKKNRLPLEE